MTRVAPSLLALGLAIVACGPSKGPQAGSQTNWLALCVSSDECGDLECMCGVCTTSCDGDAACPELPGASCVAADDEGAVAVCGGHTAPSDLCLARCEQSCPEGTACVAGTCAPTGEPTARVVIDPSAQHETLVGFGASLSYSEDAIVANPDKQALYDFVFADSGLDVLRFGNRYSAGMDADLSAPSEIIAAASERMEREPLLFMTSASPPAALKANGAASCAGNAQTCTLTTLPAGGFDYEGFAAFWRGSLEGYAAAGILPDYIGIQNDPNWLPPSGQAHEACRFLPAEGTTTATVDGADVEVAYPGYREALAAVRNAISDLPAAPRFLAPETGDLGSTQEYAAGLDAATFDALAIHLYDVDAAAVDPTVFSSVRDLAHAMNRPVLQTEMQAGGIETAVLVHHSFVDAGATAYMQNDLAAWMPSEIPVALVQLTDGGFEALGPYYALSHFAKNTDPGWVRVDATSDTTEVLGSAWISPDESSLTVVLVNPANEDREVQVALPQSLRASMTSSTVTRTVFEGSERAAMLGELPASATVELPAGSIVTVALTTP